MNKFELVKTSWSLY